MLADLAAHLKFAIDTVSSRHNIGEYVKNVVLTVRPNEEFSLDINLQDGYELANKQPKEENEQSPVQGSSGSIESEVPS